MSPQPVNHTQLSEDRIERRLSVLRNSPFCAGNVVMLEHLDQSPVEAPLGPEFWTTPKQLARHQVVMGTTGAGKSKYLELFGRHLMDHLCGFTFIDPHGDTVEELMAYAAKMAEDEGDDSILHRIHYLRPSFDQIFAFDFFQFPDIEIPPENRAMAEASWLHTAADRLTRALLRGYTSSEIEIMVRLLRWLKNLLTAVGTGAGSGHHLPFADIYVLLNKRHKRHDDVFLALEPYMPPEVVDDFERLKAMPRIQDEDHYTESVMNRLRAFLSPIVQAIFTSDAPSIDFRHIIDNRHILLVNLKETDFFSREQGLAIAGVMINELVGVVSRTSEEKRTSHHLIIDEAGYYVAEDMERLLTEARKWKLSLCLGGQSLRTFIKGEVDLFEVIADCCNMFISFKQRNVKTVEQLGKFFAYPNRVLAERMDVRDRPDGWVVVPFTDRSTAITEMDSETESSGHTDVRGGAMHIGKARARGEAETNSAARGINTADTWNEGRSTSNIQSGGYGTSDTSSMQPIFQDGQMIMLPATGSGASNFDSSGHAETESLGKGGSLGITNIEGHAHTTNQAESDSIGLQLNAGKADTIGSARTHSTAKTQSETTKHTPLAVTREELHPTGEPRFALPYQDAIHETILATAPDRYALARIGGEGTEKTVLFRTSDVVPPFADAYEQREARDAFKARVIEQQSYIVHNPSVPHATQNERLDAFLKLFTDARNRSAQEEQPPTDSAANPYDM